MAPLGSVTGGAIDLSEGEKGHEGTNVEAQQGFHVCVWLSKSMDHREHRGH
jgi:hypothetical protein